MKLEIGKRYVRRDGVITGPLVANPEWLRSIFPFLNPDGWGLYTEDGRFVSALPDHRLDIVDEYPEQSESLSTPVHSDLESRILNALRESVRLFRNIKYDAYTDEKQHVDFALVPLIAELESRIGNPAPADEPAYSASQQMQVAIDATLSYPEAMQWLNDREITFMIRDDDRYHVTTLNDGAYTINEAGFLFQQIKL